LHGIVQRRACGASTILSSHPNWNLDPVRADLDRSLALGGGCSNPEVRFSPRMKRVLSLALFEAGLLSDDRLRSEHLLLAILAEDSGSAAVLLAKLDVTLDEVRFAAKKLKETRG